MKYIDMHCDTMASIWYSRLRGENFDLSDAPLMVNLNKLKQGDCLCQTFAMFVYLNRPENFDGYEEHGTVQGNEKKMDPWFGVNEILKVFQEQMEKHQGEIRQVRTGTEIAQALQEASPMVTALLSVEEGGVCKGDLEALQKLYDAGARMMTLTWNFENELASPNVPIPGPYYRFVPRTDNGLKKRGFEFVERMQQLSMLVDVSHLSDAGFYDVEKTVKGPFIASHSNARSVCGCNRNMTDDMIRRLANHGGVMGLNFAPEFLEESDHPRETVENAVRMASYIKKVGGIDVLGLGSDFDGIEGELEIGGADQMELLADGLSRAGFTASEIEQVFYKNVLRVFQEVLG